MEKNLKRVHRWIDRCIAACGSQKWDSALAEVECAKAELESARETIWQKASGSGEQSPTGQIFMLSFRSLAFALLVVMVAALPISTGGYAPMGVGRTGSLTLEWVTSDEQSVLKALRTSLSDMNFAREAQSDSNITLPGIRVPADQVRQQPAVGREEAGADPLDKILTLIEIGQRALRGEGSVIQKLK
ncbi:MAG: hypothetical protein RQ767_03800 [Thermovirgaceae bacterium]|nr:hypothetical protein [Thermovirgaceae bacterium]